MSRIPSFLAARTFVAGGYLFLWCFATKLVKGRKRRQTTYDVEHRVAKHLRPFFGTKRSFEIILILLDQYVGSGADKAAPATVNKELAYLRRAFRLGYRHEPQLVEAVPTICMLPISKAEFPSTTAARWGSPIGSASDGRKIGSF
ncbi:MAG: hypothetical protein ACR2JB_03655 [Bryobacteraceae bacterium]